jgi:hypothetical protein
LARFAAQEDVALLGGREDVAVPAHEVLQRGEEIACFARGGGKLVAQIADRLVIPGALFARQAVAALGEGHALAADIALLDQPFSKRAVSAAINSCCCWIARIRERTASSGWMFQVVLSGLSLRLPLA